MLRSSCAISLVVFSLGAAAGNPGERFSDPLPAFYCIYEIDGGRGEADVDVSVHAEDINNRGQVIGSTTAPGTTQAYVWHRGRTRILGVAPGQLYSNGSSINDSGVAVGDSFNPDTGTLVSFVWDARRGMRVLDASLGADRHRADGISRFGQITGSSQLSSGEYHAFRRDRNGEVLDLGVLGSARFREYSYGLGINDFGTVVGITSADDPRLTEGFIWSESAGMQPLTEPDDLAAFPRAINNRGEVVGATEESLMRAFLWTAAGGRQDLGSLSGVDTDYSEARDINEWGTVVGASLTETQAAHAFIWRRQHGMRDLNLMLDETSELAPHVEVQIAKAINDLGWIVAEGNDLRQLGGSHSFLLVPRWHAGHPGCDRRRD
jgi:probable HAF family extracellular repeat protein